MYDEGRPTQPVWSEQDAFSIAFGTVPFTPIPPWPGVCS